MGSSMDIMSMLFCETKNEFRIKSFIKFTLKNNKKEMKKMFLVLAVLISCSNSVEQDKIKSIYFITEKAIDPNCDSLATFYYSNQELMWKGITKLDSFKANRKLYYVGDTIIK